MKTISKFLAITVAVIITSCTGPMGPPGYDGIDGIDGKDGTSFIGSIFEIPADFTSQNDVQVFLEGSLNLNTLLPAEWQNQVFRIAVLPADFAALKSVDLSDFNSIIKSPKLKLNTIEKINLNQIKNI